MEAGAACVAARSLLSSSAKYLLARLPPTGGSPLLPETSTEVTNNNPRSGGGGGNDYGSRGARRCHADADRSDTGDVADLDRGEVSGPGSSSLLSDLVWRYLELGARGRVCVAALRRTARQLAGSGGGGGKGGGSAGVRGSAASTEGEEEEERAATRLEEGLSLGEDTRAGWGVSEPCRGLIKKSRPYRGTPFSLGRSGRPTGVVVASIGQSNTYWGVTSYFICWRCLFMCDSRRFIPGGGRLDAASRVVSFFFRSDG